MRPMFTGLLGAAVWVCGVAAQPLAQPAATAPEIAVRPGGAPQPGGRYVVDPTHTFVVYEVGHYGTSTNRGRLSTRAGHVHVNAAGDGCSVDITIDMASINTGVDLLNRHLQSPDFLDVANFPQARFSAECMQIDDGQIREIRGQLTIRGQTHPVTMHAVRFNCYLSPVFSRQVCGGDFEAVIARSQWGITWGLQFGFEDQVRLLTQIEAVLMTDPGGPPSASATH
jgi:polyisoprenoid-binding protein YceI